MLPASEGWERLHPLSPVVRALRAGWLILVVVVQNLAEGDGLPAPVVGGVIVGVVVLTGAYSYVAWRATGFRTRGADLDLRTGVLFRSHRQVPLARLETVDIRRPLFARIVGLAEVRVEVVSRGGSEVALRYLTDHDARAVRDRLAALAATANPAVTPVAAGARAGEDPGLADDAAAGIAPPPGPVAPVRPILQVPATEIIAGYSAPVLAIFAVIALGSAVAIAVAGLAAVGPALGIAVVSALPGLFAAATRIEGMLNFRLGESDDALHVERGLLNQLHQRVNVGRIQAIRIEEPLLWRLFGRARLTVDVAGYRGGGGKEGAETAVLLPIGPQAAVQYLLDRIREAEPTDRLTLVPPPPSARGRSPLRWRHFRVAFTDDHAVIASGRWWKRTDIVPHAKIQGLRVTDGPWQRALGLATLHFHTAGTGIKARARHRAVDDAVVLALRSRALDAASRAS